MRLIVNHARPNVYRIDMINSKNASVTERMMVCVLIVAHIDQDHDVAMRSRSFHDVLRMSDIIGSVVDPQKAVWVHAIVLEQNIARIAFSLSNRSTCGISDAAKNMLL